MLDAELQALQMDARFKTLESQLAAKVEELAAREQAVRAEIAPLAARLEALEKKAAERQVKK